VPLCGPFVGSRHSQDRALGKGSTEDLHANREPAGKTTGDRDAAEASQVQRNRKDVREIHLQRVIELFTQPKGCGRGRRGDQRIALF